MFQVWQRLCRPSPEILVVAVLRVRAEEVYCLLMSFELRCVINLVKLLAVETSELIWFPLVTCVERSGKLGVHLAACYQSLWLLTGLGVIPDHLGREGPCPDPDAFCRASLLD